MLALRGFAGLSGKRFPVTRLASSLVTKFDAAVDSMPLKEAVKYKRFDRRSVDLKWTAKDYNAFINAHASALLDFNIKKGDNIALWLPEGAEKHVTMMAAAKAGIKVVDIDMNLTDISDIRAFLKASECKVIYFKTEHGAHDIMRLLRQAIPEFFDYDDEFGQMFRSQHFPKLRFFVHTAQNLECGALNYKQLFLPDPTEDMIGKAAANNTDDDVIYQQITKANNGGIEVGPAVTAGKALEHPAWYFAKKVVDKEYFEL